MSGTVTPTSQPFAEAIAFLANKLGRNLPSRTWTDTYGRVNSVGFAVAGATRDALLVDMGEAVLRAMQSGSTPKEFQVDFEAIAARYQWAYKGKPAWRAATILNTNLRSAYAAGKWQQAQQTKARRPYLRYSAVMDNRTRRLHREWHGTVLPVDHPWWKTHFPPNGWGCRCTVMSLNERDLKRYGWKVSDPAPDVGLIPQQVDPQRGVGIKAVPAGIDPGFEHNPGAVLEAPLLPQLADDLDQGFVAPIARAAAARELARRGAAFAPPPPPDLPKLPPARPVDRARLLPPEISDQAAIDAFMAEFGATVERPAAIDDRAGGRLLIGPQMFNTPAGVPKLARGMRKPYLLLLADMLRDPDEVWVALDVDDAGRVFVRRRTLGLFTLEGDAGEGDAGDGGDMGGLAVFEWGSNRLWTARTIFAPKADQPQADAEAYLDSRARFGVRLYAREG